MQSIEVPAMIAAAEAATNQPVPYGQPAPPRSDVTLTLNAKGDYQWGIELSCTPGDEDAMLVLLDRVNARIAARYRPEVNRMPATDEQRVLAVTGELVPLLVEGESRTLMEDVLGQLGFVRAAELEPDPLDNPKNYIVTDVADGQTA